jgi:hypothetical protein
MNLYSHLDNFETGCLSCIQRGFRFTRNYIIPSILLLKMYTIYKLNEYTSLLLNVKDYEGIREELEEKQERLEEFKQSQSYSHSNEEIEPSCPKWFLAMDAIPLTQIEIRSIQDKEQENEEDDENDDEDVSTTSSFESQHQNEDEQENQSVSQSESDNELHDEPPEENDENVSDSDETKSQNTSSEIVSEVVSEAEAEPENRPLEYPITIDTMIPEHIPEGCLTAYQALLLAELNPRMYKVMVVFMDGQMKTFYGDERIERS